MALLLCGFSAFLVVQAIKALFLPTILPSRVKIFLVVTTSYGVSIGLFPHRVVDLVIYGAAGAGLAMVIHRFARLTLVVGDWIIEEILRKKRR